MKKIKNISFSDVKKFINEKGFEQINKFLNEKGFKILSDKKNKKVFFYSGFKSIYYTTLCSLVIISFFFSIPVIKSFKNTSKEVKNNSKIKLEKVLSGETIEESEEALDAAKVYEDIFKFDDIPTETVRLSASTIDQLFKDTGYNIEDVRKNKIVKPIALSLLPNEMKLIENTKKRKNLFIQIILPLILEENNQIKLNRKKLFNILNKNNNSKSEQKWLKIKFKQYGVKENDLSTLKIRMDEVPVSLAIAQAAKETGWGTSRFALEGNALFGQWTYSGSGIKPLDSSDDQTHKVMKFKILKASIRAYQRNLNTHSSYRSFRKVRAQLRDNNEKLDSMVLADYLENYAETGTEYTLILKKIIKQNSLKDFDEVKLLPTRVKLKNLI
jgi:Bax protein